MDSRIMCDGCQAAAGAAAGGGGGDQEPQPGDAAGRGLGRQDTCHHQQVRQLYTTLIEL